MDGIRELYCYECEFFDDCESADVYSPACWEFIKTGTLTESMGGGENDGEK